MPDERPDLSRDQADQEPPGEEAHRGDPEFEPGVESEPADGAGATVSGGSGALLRLTLALLAVGAVVAVALLSTDRLRHQWFPDYDDTLTAVCVHLDGDRTPVDGLTARDRGPAPRLERHQGYDLTLVPSPDGYAGFFTLVQSDEPGAIALAADSEFALKLTREAHDTPALLQLPGDECPEATHWYTLDVPPGEYRLLVYGATSDSLRLALE